MAVSLQNLFPKLKQRWLIVALGGACFLAAVLLDITRFQNFLYLIGSFFVPLFGMLTADFFVLKGRRYNVVEFYRAKGVYWYTGGVNVRCHYRVGRRHSHLSPGQPFDPWGDISAWQKMVPTTIGIAGGSAPSFAVAFVFSLLFRFAGEAGCISLEERQ